jgi:hypothetical protein
MRLKEIDEKEKILLSRRLYVDKLDVETVNSSTTSSIQFASYTFISEKPVLR